MGYDFTCRRCRQRRTEVPNRVAPPDRLPAECGDDECAGPFCLPCVNDLTYTELLSMLPRRHRCGACAT